MLFKNYNNLLLCGIIVNFMSHQRDTKLWLEIIPILSGWKGRFPTGSFSDFWIFKKCSKSMIVQSERVIADQRYPKPKSLTPWNSYFNKNVYNRFRAQHESFNGLLTKFTFCTNGRTVRTTFYMNIRWPYVIIYLISEIGAFSSTLGHFPHFPEVINQN